MSSERYLNLLQQKKNIVLALRSGKELFEKAVDACKRRPPPPKVDKLRQYQVDSLRCIEKAYKTIDAHLGDVVWKSPFLRDLHPLFYELLLLSIDEKVYKECLARINSSRKILRKIYLESRKGLKVAGTRYEIMKIRRSYFGRTLSVLKSLDFCLKKIREFQETFLRLPELDVELPTIVIAGAPNVGKSTLLRALTNAKPKVSPYPFTTKELNLGMLNLKNYKVQLVDTPGLLDTPLSQKNKIERQAVLAIRHVAKVIIYVVDPTETCGFTLEFQKKVFDEISANFPNLRCIMVINKIDAVRDEQIDKLYQIFGHREFIAISAEKKHNIEALIKTIETIISGEADTSSGH